MHGNRGWILKVTAMMMTLVFTIETNGQQTNFPPVNTLVRKLILENGGITNALPKFAGEENSVREVTRDKYGAQVWFKGKQLLPLQEMFTAAYGKPVYTRTNDQGLTMFQFSKPQVGVGLNCTLSETKDGAAHTHLIVLGAKGLEELAGKADDEAAPKEKSVEEVKACDLAIKAAIEKGMQGELQAFAVGSTNLGWVVKVFDVKKGMFSADTATVGISRNWRVVHFEAGSKESR